MKLPPLPIRYAIASEHKVQGPYSLQISRSLQGVYTDNALAIHDVYTRDQVNAHVLYVANIVKAECVRVCESMHEEDRPSDYAYAIKSLEIET